MRRAIARWQTWWVRLFVLTIVGNLFLSIPRPFDLVLMVVPFLLFLVRPPVSGRAPVELAAPVRGRWVAINSPGSAVPSHGVKAYGQMYAVDLLQPARDAAASVGWGLRVRRPESYPSFGAPVRAMAPGTVVRVLESQRDHGARDTWPQIVWMMTVEGFVRELVGAARILGNHVVVRHDDGTWSAYAHLRHGSARVRVGQRVDQGEVLAEVGNTGNTSEPHLHVQLMDRPSATEAAGVPMHWPDVVADPAELDPRWASGAAKPTAQRDFPVNGQVFRAG